MDADASVALAAAGGRRVKHTTPGYSGGETLAGADVSVPDASILNFWQWAYSDLLDNVTRGVFGEWLVAKLLGLTFEESRPSWQAWDIEMANSVRIEVKTSAYVHKWTPADTDDAAKPKKRSRIEFTNLRTKAFMDEAQTILADQPSSTPTPSFFWINNPSQKGGGLFWNRRQGHSFIFRSRAPKATIKKTKSLTKSLGGGGATPPRRPGGRRPKPKEGWGVRLPCFVGRGGEDGGAGLMARAKKPTGPKPVDSLRHQDKRANIPTNELRGFVEGDESAPAAMLYPRDPSLDPQLVWKGKDEQDRQPLEVPVVPIYIQEKILPQAIIENLRDTARKGEPEPEMTLFNDYDGIEFQELVEFYRHEQNWANRMILGDSLLVMTSLAEKEGLKGKVQMIYMDPPYGIKFGSNWQVSTRKRDVKDGKAEDATRQPEQIKAFRDTWELGIHSYLAYLRDRLVVSRELLSETGSIFVQIGDENVHLVRAVMDEVFGSENFVSQITYSKTTGATTVMLPGTADYLLWFSKRKEVAKYRSLFIEKAVGGEGGGKYDQLELPDGTRRPLSSKERSDPSQIPAGARVFRFGDLSSQSVGRAKGEGAASWFPVHFEGGEYRPHLQRRWSTNEEGMRRLLLARRVQATTNTLAYVRFIDDFPAFPLTNTWMDIGGIQSRADPKVYVVQTATTAIQRCMLMTTDPGDIVLDPTCGGGSTAYAAEQWGRRWITADTSRVALALRATRLMGARFPYYALADSPEGAKREAELTGVPPAPLARRPQGLRLQARAARHAEVDRQQPRHPGGHVARRDRRRHPPPRRHRAALRPALRGPRRASA